MNKVLLDENMVHVTPITPTKEQLALWGCSEEEWAKDYYTWKNLEKVGEVIPEDYYQGDPVVDGSKSKETRVKVLKALLEVEEAAKPF